MLALGGAPPKAQMAECRSPHSPAATSAASTAAAFPAARIYAAVLPFTSASFLALSAFTPWLEVDVKKSYPEASPDDVAKMVASRSALFSFSHGVCSVCIAGWAGMLSDRFGRRICASLPAVGQAVGYSLLALVVWYDLGVYYALAAWTLTGALGGTFVFLAAAFAYIADFTRSGGRGRAFSRLDSIMLYVACIGPLFSGPLVAAVGYAGVWALAAGMYAVAALLFATAPPSPQPAAPRASLGGWVHSFTPLLLLRLVSERRGQLLGLVLAFLLATGGVQAGVQGFVLYAQRYLGWGQDMLGLFSALFSALGATLILFVHPIACRLLGSAPSDLSMVRASYLLPLAYFAALAALPTAATEAAPSPPLSLAPSPSLFPPLSTSLSLPPYPSPPPSPPHLPLRRHQPPLASRSPRPSACL